MERGTDGTEKRLGGDAYPERHAVPRAASVTSQETHSTPAEEKRASLEDVDENELDWQGWTIQAHNLNEGQNYQATQSPNNSPILLCCTGEHY